jgi:hypothetical protein
VTDSSNGWKRFFEWCGQVAPATVVLGAIIGLIIYVIHVETSDLRHDSADMKARIADLESALKGTDKEFKDQLFKTNDRIDQVLSRALERTFPATRGTKPTVGSLEKGAQIISIAKATNSVIDRTVLAKYGSVVSEWSEDPLLSALAWRDLSEVANYRSFLNADFVPTPNDLTTWPENGNYRISVNTRPNPSVSGPALAFRILFSGGRVGPEYSARLETLSEPQSASSNVGLFVMQEGSDSLVLDGMYMKNVIVRNAHVFYGGGPVRLENVSFVNCIFTFVKNKPTIKLSNSILQASTVSFSTVSPA